MRMSNEIAELKTLGKAKAQFEGLETFKAPAVIYEVSCVTEEVTALCPVTGQPDWYQVQITYVPSDKCVESKSLKLYLQKFRQDGHFCENFSSIICQELDKALQPCEIRVTVTQKPRGGIAIVSTSQIKHYTEAK